MLGYPGGLEILLPPVLPLVVACEPALEGEAAVKPRSVPLLHILQCAPDPLYVLLRRSVIIKVKRDAGLLILLFQHLPGHVIPVVAVLLFQKLLHFYFLQPMV